MKFETDNISIYQNMIKGAVIDGLTFKAYSLDNGTLVIEYTGGF